MPYVYKGKSVTLILNLRKVKWKVSWSSSRIASYTVLSHFSCVWLSATLWTVACQVPLSMGFSRQEYWRGLLFPSPGDLPASGIETSPPVTSIAQGQLLSCIRLFATPWTAASQASISIFNSQSLLKFMSIESVMPSNYLILCHPLLLPSIFPSIRVFSNESVLHIRLPKYWSFSFSISPSNKYAGLFSFRMDWLDLLAVQGTLKSLLQHHSSKASVLWCSAFFIVQHLYMTTKK